MKRFALFLLGLFLLLGCMQQKTTTDCNSFVPENCESPCRICPPCEACSSIRCNTDEFCSSIGFDKVWSDAQKQNYKNVPSS